MPVKIICLEIFLGKFVFLDKKNTFELWPLADLQADFFPHNETLLMYWLSLSFCWVYITMFSEQVGIATIRIKIFGLNLYRKRHVSVVISTVAQIKFHSGSFDFLISCPIVVSKWLIGRTADPPAMRAPHIPNVP